jgi:hypothetical protein
MGRLVLRRNGRALMKLAATRELHEYWNKLRRERSAPERSEIDPVALRGVLADTFILEVNSRAGFPFRIAGTRTSAMFQRELRGRPFLELWRGDETRAEIRDVLACVCDEAWPVVVGASTKPAGFKPLEVEVLLLPLRHHGVTHARILGLCAPTAAPPWLGLTAIAPLSLLSTRVLRRPSEEFGDFLAIRRENAPSPPSTPLSRRAHFYLIVDGDRRS